MTGLQANTPDLKKNSKAEFTHVFDVGKSQVLTVNKVSHDAVTADQSIQAVDVVFVTVTKETNFAAVMAIGFSPLGDRWRPQEQSNLYVNFDKDTAAPDQPHYRSPRDSLSCRAIKNA